MMRRGVHLLVLLTSSVFVRGMNRPLSNGGRKKAVIGGGLLIASSQRSLRRAARFEVGAVGIACKYAVGWVRCIGTTDERRRKHALDQVHEETAEDILALVRSMRGAYIKSAQLVSTAFPEVLPLAWVRNLESLTDDAPARDWPSTRRIVARELSVELSEVFASFDEAPIGAASIGQVHRATLKDGRRVCVKIMYPGVEGLIMSDLGNVRRVLRLVKPVLVPAVDEFRDRVQHEFDYVLEAQRMARVRRHLSKDPRRHGDVVVPEPMLELTTRRVLTMTWLDGRSLRETLLDRHARILGSKQPFRFLTRPFALLALKRTALSGLRRTADAQAASIFGDGAFSCDPHPGNVMLLRGGKLGLVDYGCFVNFGDEERLNIARLYCALASRDTDGIVQTMLDMGFKSEKNDPKFIVAFATQCFDRDIFSGGGGGRSPYSVLQSLESTDKLIKIPKSYMLVARVSLLLRGLATKCGSPGLSCAQLWRRDAMKHLRDRAKQPDDDLFTTL